MTTIRLNKRNVAQALRAARDRRGKNYVYTNPICVYVERTTDGKPEPSCLVGEVLITDFGIPIEAVGHCPTTAEDVLEILRGKGLLDFTDGASEMLMRAQEAQDARKSWGEAVALALEV